MVENSPKIILCIEDEQEMIDLIRLILSRRGFDVRGANSGEEGLEIIRKEPRPHSARFNDAGYGWLGSLSTNESDDATKDIPVIVVTPGAEHR